MKYSKAVAHYRKATVTTKNCGVCRSMNADGSCDRVQGKVARAMVCDYFQAKKK